MYRKHLVALLTAVALAVPAIATAQRLVYVVRHAERADGGMPAAGVTKPDPPLSEAGKARADKLASMLAVSGVTAIYATEFVRTQQTAAPVAAALKLKTIVMPSAGTADLVARLKADHPQRHRARRRAFEQHAGDHQGVRRTAGHDRRRRV